MRNSSQVSMDDESYAEQQVPTGFLTSINFSIVTEEDFEKVAVKEIGTANEVTDPMLGLPNPTSQCQTCGAKDVKTCEGHFGLIRFPFTILHPFFMSEVVKILNRICPGCKSVRRRVKGVGPTSIHDGPETCKYCDRSLKDKYPTVKFKVASKEIYGRTAILAEVNEKLVVKFQRNLSSGSLASDYWDFIPNDPQHEGIASKPNKRVLSHIQAYHLMKDVDPSLLEEFFHGKKSSMLLNSFPVTPNSHRVTELGQHMIFDERTRAYRKLIDFRGPPNELSTRVLDCLRISKLRSEQPSTKAYAPTTRKKDNASKMSGLKYVKDLILGKRTDRAFRMVVVGDPNIKLDEVGLPYRIAEVMQISEHLNSWNREKLQTYCDLRILKRGETFIRREGALVRLTFLDSKLQTGDIIYRPLRDGDIVLMNRPPSIHPHSLIALSVKVLPLKSVLSLNPLICSPFRGDFDGDCFHGYVPQSVDSRVELHELVTLNKQLINAQSGENLLSLSHDSLTAAHMLINDEGLLNRFQMQQLQMFCPHQLQLPTVIKAPSPDNFKASRTSALWSGKQLFSLLLPPDFDFVYPPDDVHISKGELVSSSSSSSWLHGAGENLLYSLVKHCQGEVLDFLHAAQEVLCEWLSVRGLSVSLSDLYLSYDFESRKNMIDEISCALEEAERISLIKLLMVDSNQDFLIGNFDESEIAKKFGVWRLCYERQKSAALSRISVSAFKQVFKDIQNLFYQYASEDNSLLAMLKSGSKSNVARAVQHGMCLGLQHSLVPLSFSIPHQLSCAAWNSQKKLDSILLSHDLPECTKSYIPYAVVSSSFLTGLNPLESFAHALTTRDSFGGHADISGTLTRRLMFFMRDLYIGYDKTVRNAYGNQVIQFSYYINDTSTPNSSPNGSLNDSAYACSMAGQPVGSLAACALSEAAYSALDQPISALETSPLLNLKEILECGGNRSDDKIVSLFLSNKLRRWTHGFEYGALEVKSNLERLRFLDIVTTVMIIFSSETCSSAHISPWVCHFHISKEIAKRKHLNMQCIIDALYIKCNSTRLKSKVYLPNLQITSKNCSVAETPKGNNATICITVSIVQSSKSSFVQLDTLKDMVIPFLLGTVIKGSSNVKKVNILWKDLPYASKTHKDSSGELYLQVFMSETCPRTNFWRVLMDDCLQVMDLIDWHRSHPEDIHNITLALGIDVARKHFLTKLESAISDTGKKILPEHLLLVADCLSSTGEFVALSANGLAQQRKQISVSSPFTQACFSSPADCFVKAAKMGTMDDLAGSVDALSWGNSPSLGTGGLFDIIYSGKGHELAKPENVYNLLGSLTSSSEQTAAVKVPDKSNHMPSICAYSDFNAKGQKHMDILKAIKKQFSADHFQRLSQELKRILQKYDIDHQLSGVEKSLVMSALYFHPRRIEKLGTGVEEVKIGSNSTYGNTRCFQLVRTDGTIEDFSYHKCVIRALELIDPRRATRYQSRWLKGRN